MHNKYFQNKARLLTGLNQSGAVRENMKHVVIRFKDGSVPIVHFEAPAGTGNDYTLCGDDTAGDTEWYPAEETKKTVTCERCQKIVRACRLVSMNELATISR